VAFNTRPKSSLTRGKARHYTGNNGVWTDHRGSGSRHRLPAGNAHHRQCGGNRLGDLFAESLVAVDLKTGKYKWHFQFVHHPIWDHDMSSAPLLIDTVVDGTPRKLVAVPSKQGWLYTFDRITGKPIWPIDEKPVPQTTMKGERTAPTQPFRPSPGLLRTRGRSDHRLHARLRKQALRELKHFRWERTPYVPPTGPESTSSARQHRQRNAVNCQAQASTQTGIFHPGRQRGRPGHYDQEEFDKVNPETQGRRACRAEADPHGLPRRPVPRRELPMEGRRKLIEGLNGLPLGRRPTA
jgi:hypothetical protein